MKMIPILASLALALSPAPALAQSLSMETSTSTNFSGDWSYGLSASLEAPVMDGLQAGVEASVEDFINDGTPTTLYGGMVLSASLLPGTAIYGSGGYVNQDGDDGFRLGTGLEQDLTNHTYARIGYDYTNFGNSRNGHAGTFALGVRF